MLDPGRPAFLRADSIDCGTHRTAKRKTSLPFICIHEYEDRFGGKVDTEPFDPNALFVSFSFMVAFRCLHKERLSAQSTFPHTSAALV